MKVGLKPFLFLFAALGAGILLAVSSLATDLPTGGLGAAVLIVWAIVSRRRWSRLEATGGLDPSAPERMLWVRLAGSALLLGHSAAALLSVGNALRVGYGNSLAIDSWTMVIAFTLATLLFRHDRRTTDERHVIIAAHGQRVGYATLIGTLLPLIGWLGFTPPPARALLSDFVIASLLIAALLVSYIALLFVQLVDYARDTHEAASEEIQP